MQVDFSKSRYVIAGLLVVVMGLTNPNGGDSIAQLKDQGSWTESTLKSMSLAEKVGQLVFVWTPGRYFPHDSEEWRELQRLLTKRHLGGLIFSIGDVYEYAVQINQLQRLAKIPLLISGDFEYGVGMRVRYTTTFPRAMAIGATRNPKYAYEVGRVTAVEGRALGVHQNYAPTVDINNNPKNPVINTRSFSDDVKLVNEMGAAFVRGTQEGGMIATVKHFPGHGDTDVDTHLGLTTLPFDESRLNSVELAPFRAAFEAGVVSVMVGHIAVPKLDTATGLPATVSHAITTKLLQDAMRFSGLVVTDAMSMRGVSTKFEPGESAVLALKAGTDLILMPVDADVAVEAIISAVRRGELTEERIERSVRKILRIKEQLGLHKNRFVDIENIGTRVNTVEHQLLALTIARDAVTVLGNKSGILPLARTDSRRYLNIVIAGTEDPSEGRLFYSHLQERFPRTELARIDPRSNKLEYETTMSRVALADVLIIQLHLSMRSGEMSGFLPKQFQEFITNLIKTGKPHVMISFGNPYVVMDFPNGETYVCGYSDAEVMQRAMVEVLFAESPARGKLPITIPGVYKFGEGVLYEKQVLRVGVPEEVGMSRTGFDAVDEVMEAAVRDSAFPGGVLFVAKNGVIVHQKAYGAYDYAPYSKRVTVGTIYDLASVTKVIATTSAVMRLVDEGKMELKDPVVKYIPPFGQHGKEKITLENLMVHNSGLPAWRKFYEFCSTPQCVLDSIYATPLAFRTGDTTVYSDLGLITMGKVIEQVTGTTLDHYVDSVFFKPLGMRSTMYNPPARLHQWIAPTEIDTLWRKSPIPVRGQVHDENCATLGGASGHAGLFSTAGDLAVFMQMLLNGGTYGGKRYLNETTVRLFTRRHSSMSTRGIGWDTKDPRRSWAGTLLSERTFLHTGFTGTSVAADPERQLIVILLTNRVHPTRNSTKIFQVRPRVHDAVVRAIVR
jgi:beta-glucosidase-like glycosyl hydrolase/CubicO group peptidase (beta-lactamase class C family)